MSNLIDPKKEPYLYIYAYMHKAIGLRPQLQEHVLIGGCGMAFYSYIRGDITEFEYNELKEYAKEVAISADAERDGA